eukprot:GHVS01094793.1.p1 GENE.GHVS01094793.1~~GHVS01094793.1.p1  ORF type:complete len:218 (+),score=48.15 GHVS01094793.1:166-819(+)
MQGLVGPSILSRRLLCLFPPTPLPLSFFSHITRNIVTTTTTSGRSRGQLLPDNKNSGYYASTKARQTTATPSRQGKDVLLINGYEHSNTNKGNSRSWYGGLGMGAGGLFVCGSPLLFSDWEEKNPKSEMIFVAGQAVEGCVKRFFENEYGQSVLLCMMFATTFMYMYKSMQLRRFVFDLKHKYAVSNIVVGQPTQMRVNVPHNNLIKAIERKGGGGK